MYDLNVFVEEIPVVALHNLYSIYVSLTNTLMYVHGNNKSEEKLIAYRKLMRKPLTL